MRIRYPAAVLLCLLTAPIAFVQVSIHAESTDKLLKLAFVANNASDFWAIARSGCVQAEKEIQNITLEFRTCTDGTAAAQTRVFDDLLAKGIDGIALSVIDPVTQTAVIDRGTEKALIVTQDSDAPKSKRAFYVGTDNIAAGRQAGELVKKAIPDGGKIMLFVGSRYAENAQQRIQAIQETLEGSNVSILGIRVDDANIVLAKQNVTDALAAYPDIACLVGIWGYNGPAIVNAVKEAGKTGQVKIVAFDEDRDTLQGIKDSAIEATVVQNPFEFGHLTLTLMARKLRGKDIKIPDTKTFLIPTTVVDKSNIDEFWARLQKLRGH